MKRTERSLAYQFLGVQLTVRLQSSCNLIYVQYVKDESRLLLSGLPKAGISFTVPSIKLKNNVIVIMLSILEGREEREAKSRTSGMWI